jgi:hypothetical protein
MIVPKTPKLASLTNLDWKKLVEKRDKRLGRRKLPR